MNTVEVLKAARELIADEKCWTQGAYARREDGEDVDPTASGACRFCALGALAKIADVDPDGDVPGENALKDAAWESGRLSIADFNDNVSHPEVLDLFDRAIASAESEAA